jgi:hypothetical protein
MSGAEVSYYLGSRHLYGPLKLEVLGPDGKVLDTITAGKRRGINRVAWTMRAPPPRVPRAAQVAFNAAQGPRVEPGTYTVRLTSGKEQLTTSLKIDLDRRAPYSIAEKRAQFDAAMRVSALFGRMTRAVGRMETARNVAMEDAEKVEDNPELKRRLNDFASKLEELKKKIVATKEGGAITGEERIREHADLLYGALMLWEGRPARYQLDRIDVLSRELSDVEKELHSLFAGRVPALDSELDKKHLESIPTGPVQEAELLPGSADLQRAYGRFFGQQGMLEETEGREERD